MNVEELEDCFEEGGLELCFTLSCFRVVKFTMVPGEARLSVPAAVDQNGNVSSSSSSFFFFFFLLSPAVRGVLAHDLGRLWTFHKTRKLI